MTEGSIWAAGLWASCWLAVLTAAAAGSGRGLVSRFTLNLDEGQKTCLGLTLGLGLEVLSGLALVSAHAFYPWAVISALGVLLVLGAGELPKTVDVLAAGAAKNLRENPLVSVLLVGGCGLVFIFALAPPHQYDSLVYHLPLAVEMLRRHAPAQWPDLLYSYFPQNGEILFATALVLKSDILAQMISGLALILSLGWLFQFSKDDLPKPARWLAAGLLAAQTSVLLLSSTTYTEPLVMLWTTAAFFCAVEGARGPTARGRRVWTILCGLFAGLGLGTKYYAGIAAALFGAGLILSAMRASREERRARFADFLIYAATVLIVFGPWLVRNALAVGDPLYPFFFPWFSRDAASWAGRMAQGYFKVMADYDHAGHFWKDLLALPFGILTGSLRYGGGMDALGVMGWDLIFLGVPFGFWASRGRPRLKACALFCGLYLAAWFWTAAVLRFLVAVAPLLCLLGGAGLWWLWEALGFGAARWVRAGLAAAAGLAVALHFVLYFFVQLGVFDLGRVLADSETRGQFLSRRLDYYPCARAASEIFGENDKILVAGEQRSYYLRTPSVVTNLYAPNPYLSWADESASSADYAKKLRGEGFSALLYVPREQSRLGRLAFPATPRGLENWNGLLEGKPVFVGPACELLPLTP